MDTSEDPLLPQAHGPIPRDRFYLVYFVFYLLGLGSLSPWNFFITASDYFKFKLRNATLTDKNYLNPGAETELQAMFEGYLTVASTIPNLLFNFITALLIKRVSLKTRMKFSLVLTIVMFTLTTVLTKINTDTWQHEFFIITIVTAMLINTGSSILCTSLFGLASLFPSNYMQASMTGQAMGGIFASLANIISLALGTHVVDSGLGFFTAATVTSILTLFAYGSLYWLNFSKYHILEIGNTLGTSVNGGEDIPVISPDRGCNYYKNIFTKIWAEGLSVCLVFFITLSCFPAIASSIISVDKGASKWTEEYFSAFVCFLLFNAGDWSGRSIAGSVQYPKFGRPYLLIFLCLLRIVFVPLLMLCNAHPRHLLVLFNSDIYPVVFIMLLGATNGYFGTLAMMYGPKRVSPDLLESTGAIMSACLTTGLVSGSLMAILLMKAL